MIWDVFNCWAALNNICDENSKLEKINFQSEHWQKLENIHTLLYFFWKYTEFVLQEQFILQLATQFYIQIQITLNSITWKKNKYVVFNNTFINAVKIEVEIFKKYNSFMQDNNIYFIVSVFDFWIKT